MDPITVAIMTGVAAGLTKVSESVVGDAYDGLKALIKKKFGEKNEVSKAIEGLETRPESDSRKGTLAEEIAAAGADKDGDIAQAAQALSKALEAYAEKASGSATIDLEGIKANTIELGKLVAETGPGGKASISIKNSKARGDFKTGDMTASAKK